MKFLRSRRFWIGLCGVLFLLGNFIGYHHARAMTHFVSEGQRTRAPERLTTMAKVKVLLTGVTLPRPTATLAPTNVAPDVEALTIPVPDGATLSGWYWPTSNAHVLVVLLHGYGADKSDLVNEARALHDLGCNTLLLDFRGSWESSENYTSIGVHEALDVAATVAFARTRWPGMTLVLYGQSMGAAATLRAIAREGIQPDAIVIEAVFDTLLNTVRNRFAIMNVPAWPGAELLTFWGGVQFGFNGFSHNPVDFARTVMVPTLSLHGAEDPRAKLEEGRRVFDAVQTTNKTISVFPKLGHQAILAAYPGQWTSAFSNFLSSLPQP